VLPYFSHGATTGAGLTTRQRPLKRSAASRWRAKAAAIQRSLRPHPGFASGL